MLRERTLQHLLLSVARSLEMVPENRIILEKIRLSCETLKVERNQRGPYEVSICLDNQQIHIEVDTARFRFHERGDVPAQIKRRDGYPDAREQNWEEATKLWEELLGQAVARTIGLAPARPSQEEINLPQLFLLFVLSVTVLTFEYFTGWTWITCIFLALMIPLTRPKRELLMIGFLAGAGSWGISGLESPILAIVIMFLVIHGESLANFRFVSIFFVIATLAAWISEVSVAPLFSILLLFELLVSVVQKNFYRMIFVVISFCTAISAAFFLSSSEFALTLNWATFGTVSMTLLLVVAMFPHSTEPNLLRISAPFSLCLGALFFGLDFLIVNAFLSTWLIRCLLPKKIKNQTAQVNSLVATPVSVRRR